MMRLSAASCVIVLLAACSSQPDRSAASAPTPLELAQKDARSMIVLADERTPGGPARADTPMAVYQVGRHILAERTHGMLRVTTEKRTREMMVAAGLRPVTGPAEADTLRIRRADVPRMLAVAAADGVDYLTIVNGWKARASEYEHIKDGRLKIIGALGIDYQVRGKGYQHEEELDLTVWHCKSGRQLFSQRFKGSDGGDIRRRADLAAWIGLSVLQRLMPESTQTERNPIAGDYVSGTFSSAELRLGRHNPPTSGVLAHELAIPVVRVARRGDEVELVMEVTNWLDQPLQVDFAARPGQGFCLDWNGNRYDLVRLRGDSRFRLQPEQKGELGLVFRIPDRNVSFVTLHLRVSADSSPDFFADTDLQWANVRLFPSASAVSTAPLVSVPAPTPSAPRPASLPRPLPVSDGSAWQMRDLAGNVYSAKQCLGKPVIVFYCEHDLLLEGTWLFGENGGIATAATHVGYFFKQVRDREFVFLWIDANAAGDPDGWRKVAAKFGLTMPTVTTDEFYRWHLQTRGQPWLTVIDADGKVVKTLRGADEISQARLTLLEGLSKRVETTEADFGEDELVRQISGGSAIASFEAVHERFSGDLAKVWAAVEAQAAATGIWRLDATAGWIHSKSYIYSGAWNLLAPSKCCRHLVAVERAASSVVVHVVTPLWKHHVDVIDERTGRTNVTHAETPDYNNPQSVTLSRKFLDGVRKRLDVRK